ncbi:Odontogenesis Associated Phosphoprotein [Manis pentadactyla]|nr:Odontogenesis Associated Phosphoprotein [Manis pentadactyla]
MSDVCCHYKKFLLDKYCLEKTSSHLSWKLTKQCRPHRLPDYYTRPSTYHKKTSDRDLAHKDTQAQSPHCISTETFPPFKVQTQFSDPSIFFLPHSHLTPHFKCFFRRKLQKGSSSEGSREKREAPGMLKQKKPMPQKRLYKDMFSFSKLKLLDLKIQSLKHYQLEIDLVSS